jgi:hypothetical protein
MGGVYDATGQMEKALEKFEQALPIMRVVGDRAGEAVTLNNMGSVYWAPEQMEKALELHQQALPIMREVGDRAGEAVTCFNVAMIYRDLGEFQKAVEYLRAAVALEKQVKHPDYEQDAATLREWEKALQEGRPFPGKGGSSSGISQDLLQSLVVNTIKENIEENLQIAQENQAEDDLEFFQAILAILEGKEAPNLKEGSPYQGALAAIQEGIADGGEGLRKAAQERERVMEAIRAYVDAESLEKMQEVVETHQELLFQEQVREIFGANIQGARQEGREDLAEMMQFHLGILLACQEEGIEETFARLVDGGS